MLIAVVFYPRLDDPRLRDFRRSYDPTADLIEPHLTLVFPVPGSPEALSEHVRKVVTHVEPFDLHIAGLKKTWDHWMYLAIREGSEVVVALHEELYGTSLAEHRRLDLTFEPHIGIGFFGLGDYDPLDPTEIRLDEATYSTARVRAEELAIDEWRRVGELTIVRLADDLTVFEDIDQIPLGP